MEYLPVSPESLERAAEVLRRGGIVAFPTETVYGLGADAYNREALAKVFQAKGRPHFDPLIIHIASVDTLEKAADLSQLDEEKRKKLFLLAENLWPGPLSLILPKSDKIPDLATAGLPTAAFRFPGHETAQKLIFLAGGAVAAPSANPFGALSPTRAEHVRDKLGEKVDMILDGGPAAVGVESTVLDISGEWFAWLGLMIFTGLLSLVLAGALYLLHFPVLEQLQGVFSKRNKKKARRGSVAAETEAGVAAGTEASLARRSEGVGAEPNLIEDTPLPEFSLPTLAREREDGYKPREREDGHRPRGRLRWIMRHIFRSPVKTVLGVFVALFFVLMLGWLQESVLRTEEGINYLYDNTLIWGEIVVDDPFGVWENRILGDVIRRRMFVDILESEYLQDVYLESANSWSYVFKANEDGTMPDNWMDIVGLDLSVSIWFHLDTFNMKYAFNDFDRFIYLNSDGDEHCLEVEFAPGFDQYSLICENGVVPLIVSEHVLYRRGLSLGDKAYISFATLSPTVWTQVPARIVGVHNGNVANERARDASFMHLYHLGQLMGGGMMYSRINFNINPAFNREVEEIREIITPLVHDRLAGHLPLRLFINDQDLHIQVGIASQALLLLELMYPIAMGAALIIAGGLALLLMLQNAKRAATLHVLGTSKGQTVLLLFAEQFIVCMAGVLPGVLALLLLGVSFNTTLMISFGLYLAGVFICAVVGAVIIIWREPLDLLQVRE